MNTENHILFFNQIKLSDIGKVGGKNASIGELFNQLTPMGIAVPNGFAVTASAYREIIKANNLEIPLKETLQSLDTSHFSNLTVIGQKARNLIVRATIPDAIKKEIIEPLIEYAESK